MQRIRRLWPGGFRAGQIVWNLTWNKDDSGQLERRSKVVATPSYDGSGGGGLVPIKRFDPDGRLSSVIVWVPADGLITDAQMLASKVFNTETVCTDDDEDDDLLGPDPC